MTTNETIAKWLGMVRMNNTWSRPNEDGTIWVYQKDYTLDFLHDRNQQGWIIDELIERGYRIEIYFSEYGSDVHIWHNDSYVDITTTSDNIDDSAFIECVLELINKELTIK